MEGHSIHEFDLAHVTALCGALAGIVIIPIAVSSRRRAFKKRIDLIEDDVAILFEKFWLLKAALDVSLCVILLIGLFIVPNTVFCQIVGFLYQFEEVFTLVSILRMIEHPYRSMLKKEDCSHTRLYFNRTLIYGFLVSSSVCIPLAAVGAFGHTDVPLCWLMDVRMQMYGFFSLVLCCWTITLTLQFRIARVVEHRRISRQHTVYHGDFFRRVTWGLIIHFAFLAFVLVYSYVFRLASRIYLWIHGSEHPVLQFLEIFTIAFRGPVDALVYMPKDWLVSLRAWWKEKWRDEDAIKTPVSVLEDEKDIIKLTLMGRARRINFFTDPPASKIEDRKIFASTYNMAEAPFDQIGAYLPGWIPLNLDIYVIGVQECMIMDELGQAILNYVGGSEKFVMFQRAIGSTATALGYHGLIGIFVLARKEEVDANRFFIHEAKTGAVARGHNIGVTTTQNKGGVGMAFRYYDTTFAVMNSHLASDSKGRSKLAKRNLDARLVIYGTNLWREEYLVDFIHQHHVTIFLGDVNYRLNRNRPASVLEDVAAICRKERDVCCGGRRDWRTMRYAAILEAGGHALTDLPPVPPPPPSASASTSSLLSPKLLVGQADVGCLVIKEENGSGKVLEEEGKDEEEDDDEEEGGGPTLTEKLVQKLGPLEPALSLLGRVTSMVAIGDNTPRHASLDQLNHQQRMSERSLASKKATGSRKSWDNDSLGSRTKKTIRSSLSHAIGVLKGPPSMRQLKLELGHLGIDNHEEGDSLIRIPASSYAYTSIRSASTWGELLQSDELWKEMQSGRVFYGFKEAEIRFPPSYRRVKGIAGDCQDYCDAELLKQTYSIAVKDRGNILARNGYSMATFSIAGRSPDGAEAKEGLSSIARRGGGGGGGEEEHNCPSPHQLKTPSSSPSKTQSSPLTRADTKDSVMPAPIALNGGGRIATPRTGCHQEGLSQVSHNGSSSYSNRIPSYTDRILLHTFADYEDRVTLGPYELSDALLASDHRPVSNIINAKVNVGIRGLNTFRQAEKRTPGDVQLDIATVYDAAFYLLELTDCEIDLNVHAHVDHGSNGEVGGSGHSEDVESGGGGGGGGGGTSFPSACSSHQPPNKKGEKGSVIKDDAYVLVLFPLDNEDSFSALRRPTTVAAVARQFAFLTSEIERNPFAFFSISSYRVVKTNGVTILSCTRPDFGGLHALFSLRDYDGRQLGGCVFSLSDSSGRPIPEQKNVRVALTVGGALTGFLKCNIKLSQYRVFPSSVHV